MSDHRELIEQARAEHRESVSELAVWCAWCQGDWPCLTARLAMALEQATPICGAIPSEDGPHSSWDDAPSACPVHAAELEIRAQQAEARTDRLAGYAQHHEHCPAKPVAPIFGGGLYPTGAPCNCGLSAALGLAGEDEQGG